MYSLSWILLVIYIYNNHDSQAHRGAQGYTVRKDRQDAVFGSLRLSKGDSSIKTGLAYKKEAMNLIHYTYDDNIYKFKTNYFLFFVYITY